MTELSIFFPQSIAILLGNLTFKITFVFDFFLTHAFCCLQSEKTMVSEHRAVYPLP